MTFKTATVTQRMGVRDAAYRLGKLAERLTLGSGPLQSDLGSEVDALATNMQGALAEAGYEAALPSGTAPVKNSDAVTVSQSGKSVPATAAVSGNTLSGVTLVNATDALASDGDAVSIQDRNSNTLKGNAVAARVSGGKLISAYFSALTDALNSDGNPLDVTTARGGSTVTGRIRVYVTNNVVRSVYLDNSAALQSGATVPVQNSAGLSIAAATVTVANNVVSAAKLPANYTAFADGRNHTVTDRNGVSANAAAAVANGSLTSQTLEAGVALVTSTSIASVTVRDNQSRSSTGLKPTFTDGKLTEFVMPDYTALVKNNMYPTFALTYDGKSPEAGDVALTARVSQAGGLSMLLPKTAVIIANGGTVTGMDGKTYSFVISNGRVVSVTVGTAS